MILQGSLQIDYNGEPFVLMVKVFLKKDTYYFFVSDKEGGKSLLAGETVELSFTNSFCPPERESDESHQKIPAEIVGAIKSMLLENKQLWFY